MERDERMVTTEPRVFHRYSEEFKTHLSLNVCKTEYSAHSNIPTNV